jgi:hypothetical protein
MKSSANQWGTGRGSSLRAWWSRCCLLMGVLLGASFTGIGTSWAQSDNFEDGNDLGWTRYDPIGSHPLLPDIASFSAASKAYRIRTVPSPSPEAAGPARAGAIRNDVSYTDFYVTVDLVDWDESFQQSVGILARVTEAGLGSTDGYVMTYNFLGKDIDITRFQNEDPAGGGLTLTGEDSLELVKGKKYRLVFFGRGTEFGARVFDLENLETPLVDCTGSDTTYPSGVCGLLVYDNSAAETMGTDATFDNYFAVREEPPKVEVLDLGFGLIHIRWGGQAAGFKLESTDRLNGTATVWAPVDELTISYFADIDRYVHQADGAAGTRFYRLVKP